MVSMSREPDSRVLRYLRFYSERITGRTEDQIAHDLDFGSPAALYRQLSQDGFPVCPVCGETPVKPNHCRENQGRRRRRARRGTGQAIELPPAKGAEPLFRKAIEYLEASLLLLDSRREFYRDKRFETVSDYSNASATYAREGFPPGEEWDQKWRELCEQHGQDPSVESFFVQHAPTTFSEGATQSPPEPLTELIASYVLAGKPLEPLLDALHPDPSQAEQERLVQAIEELGHKAGQLGTLVRGGTIRRGPSTGELSRSEQNAARFISDQLRQGVSEAEISEVLGKHGFSVPEITRLMNLKIEPPQ